MSGGGYVQREVCIPGPMVYPHPLDMGPKITPVLTPSGGHQNTCSLQAGGAHPPGMLAFLFLDVGNWPEEREYTRSERSEIGSGSNFTNSRVGVGSQMYEEDDEDIRYEVRIRARWMA